MGLVTTASPEIGRSTLVPWLWAGVFSIRLYSCVPVTKQAEKKKTSIWDNRMYCHFKGVDITVYFLVYAKKKKKKDFV